MARFTSPFKWAFAGAFCASVLLLPMYILGTLVWLANAALHTATGEHAGEMIGSTGVWVAALIVLAACGGFAYGCYEIFVKKSSSEKQSMHGDQ